MTLEDHESIHRVYCDITHRDMPLSFPDHMRWSQWKARGWNEFDLRLVVAFIQRRIKSGRRYVESLRLHNLIDPARFADDLLDAHAERRQPRPSPRQAVLRAVHRPEQDKDRCKPVAEVMAEHEKMSALLKAYREQL